MSILKSLRSSCKTLALISSLTTLMSLMIVMKKSSQRWQYPSAIESIERSFQRMKETVRFSRDEGYKKSESFVEPPKPARHHCRCVGVLMCSQSVVGIKRIMWFLTCWILRGVGSVLNYPRRKRDWMGSSPAIRIKLRRSIPLALSMIVIILQSYRKFLIRLLSALFSSFLVLHKEGSCVINATNSANAFEG
jgi:hypothetical protein